MNNSFPYLNENQEERISVERIIAFERDDLHQLCQACEDAIASGGGFGWVTPPGRDVLERYWQGLLLIEENQLFVGRLDREIVGSIQLRIMPPNQEARRHVGLIGSAFVAPWARGHGIARTLAETAEKAAIKKGLKVLELDVRETQNAAITAFEHLGFIRIGENPHYALVNSTYVRGFYYKKYLGPEL